MWRWWTRASVVLVLLALACGSSSVPSPFEKDAGSDTDASDARDAADPTLGGPCLDDAQCDDGIDCTLDRCDSIIQRCRFSPDGSKCQDGKFCNGLEVCEPGLGCREGEAVACNDNDTCTIDTCIEATKTCKNVARDADGDGDPDWSCGGGDCNDTNPLISSKQSEICGNGQDDNCNGQIDEKDCQAPAHDTCATALDIKTSGTYALSLAAAKKDYSATCETGDATAQDVVAAVVVPDGPAQDVDIVALASSGSLALAAAEQCGDPESELACGKAFALDQGGLIARIRLRSLLPGAYPVYVFGSGGVDVTLKVNYLPATSKPANETCGTATAISPGVSTSLSLVDAGQDLTSHCTTALGELVYALTLAAPQDVNVWATSTDNYGKPAISLWEPACDDPKKELSCNVAKEAHMLFHSLAAGTHYVAVSASAPTDIDLLVEVSPPTPPPPDETCASGATLVPNKTESVSLTAHSDDIQATCLAGAVDAAYGFDVAAPSDLLLVGRISEQDVGAVSLMTPPCASASDLLACAESAQTPVRAAYHKLQPGNYRAVIETLNGAPTELTAFVRSAVPATLVAFADTCAQAVKIPAGGGWFQGTTSGKNADYDAGCDLGGQNPGGAPDQMLKLTLSAQKRVILDMKGSQYDTLLAVHKASACPGPEVTSGCAAGYYSDRSYLDLTLAAGDYYVQIDGYGGDAGAWTLEVFVVDP